MYLEDNSRQANTVCLNNLLFLTILNSIYNVSRMFFCLFFSENLNMITSFFSSWSSPTRSSGSGMALPGKTFHFIRISHIYSHNFRHLLFKEKSGLQIKRTRWIKIWHFILSVSSLDLYCKIQFNLFLPSVPYFKLFAF